MIHEFVLYQPYHKAAILLCFTAKCNFAHLPFRFSFSTGYYGLAFHISHLFGSKYLNLAISTILDVTVATSLVWIVPRLATIYHKFFINPVLFVLLS